jgi:hypothetical protein
MEEVDYDAVRPPGSGFADSQAAETNCGGADDAGCSSGPNRRTRPGVQLGASFSKGGVVPGNTSRRSDSRRGLRACAQATRCTETDDGQPFFRRRPGVCCPADGAGGSARNSEACGGMPRSVPATGNVFRRIHTRAEPAARGDRGAGRLGTIEWRSRQFHAAYGEEGGSGF